MIDIKTIILLSKSITISRFVTIVDYSHKDIFCCFFLISSLPLNREITHVPTSRLYPRQSMGSLLVLMKSLFNLAFKLEALFTAVQQTIIVHSVL